MVLTVTHAQVQQVVDLIPVASRFDAPGNIGDGRRDQLKLTATLPLDRLGLAGAQIAGEASWRRSKVTDPVTGRSRRISNERPFEGQLHFSQDLARLRSTWGIDGEFAYSETEYRIDEVRRTATQAYWTVYWDWKPRDDLSLRIEAQNFTARDFSRSRTLYDGSRSAGRIDALERRHSVFDPFVFIRLRKTL